MHALFVTAGRAVALELAKLGRQWRSEAAKRMPEARGDIREIVGQPVFLPLFKLYTVYGKVCSSTAVQLTCISRSDMPTLQDGWSLDGKFECGACRSSGFLLVPSHSSSSVTQPTCARS
jgi:hypothetical protein